MIPLGRGVPGSHGPPPPLPPSPSSSSSSSSSLYTYLYNSFVSSSTLSPLAPPFTVGPAPSTRRSIDDHADQNPRHPELGTLEELYRWNRNGGHGTPPRVPPFSFFSTPPSSSSVGSDPCYAPADHVPEREGYPGVSVGRWSRAFGGGEARRARDGERPSSWMEPSSGRRLPSVEEGDTADGFIPFENATGVWHSKYNNYFPRNVHFGPEFSASLHDMHSETHEENTIAPYNISAAPVLDPSSLCEGISNCHLPESMSLIESSGATGSNPYAGYITYPDKTCPTSAQVLPSSIRRTASPWGCSLPELHSMRQQVDPYNISNSREDRISTNPKESNINQNAEVREGNDERINTNFMRKYTGVPVDPFSKNTSLSLGNELAAGNSLNSYIEAYSGLELKRLNLSNTSFSECCPAEHGDSMESSSQALDQLNLAVDSPCWKGTPASRESLFGDGETAGVHPVEREWKGYYELDRGQEHVSLSVAYSEVLPPLVQPEFSICDENEKASSKSYTGEPCSVILQSILQNSDDAIITGPDSSKDDRGKGVHCSEIYKEQHNKVRKDQNGNPEAKDNEVTQEGKEEIAVSAHHHITTDGIGSLEPDPKTEIRGKSSFLGNDGGLLVKTMHNLSVVLLSYLCNTNELKEVDHELLQLVIENLEEFTLKNKKTAQSQDISKADLSMKKSNNDDTHDLNGEMHPTGFGKNSGGISKGSVSEVSKLDGIAQAFEKVLEKTSFEDEDNPQALLYKNLWIEAEVALCSTKYELHLARMQSEMENHKHQTKGETSRHLDLLDSPGMKPLQMFDVSSRNSKHDLEGHGNPLNAKEISHGTCYGKPHKAFGVLKGRTGRMDPTSEEQQGPMGAKETECSDHSEGESSAGSERLCTDPTDLVFIGSSPRSSFEDELGIEGGADAIGSQSRGGNYDQETGFTSSIMEFQWTDAEGPSAVQRLGSTSEWEHVLKQDVVS